MKLKYFKSQQGFSVIEIILAAAIFLIFSGGTIFVMLQGYTSNQLGEEEMIANQYASEGLEAVRSIKNQSFSNLANTTGAGLSRSGGNVWTFNGVSNNLGKYTRIISVSAVQRDVSGNIVASGGTTDTDTKKVASTVSWNASPTRNNSIVLTTYLTNWKAVIAAGNNGDGVMMYGESTSVARPFYRIYTNSTNTFSSQATTGSSFTDTLVGKNFKVKTSPTKQEAIAGYVNNSGELRIMCFDGTTWSSEWTVTVGGDGTNDQRFGISYENTTGDVLLVYSTDTATTNEMAYRTKSGATGCGAANWSSATSLDAVRTSGIVQWIRMEPSSVAGSNTIAIAWADKVFGLSAREWTGSSFAVAEPAAALETNLERVGSLQDVPSFDIAMESTSGNLMVVWGLSQATTCTAGTAIAATNCIRYARYTTSWSAVAAIPTVADPATTIDISANPNTNELVVASFDNSQLDLSAAYWSGSAWTGRADLDTTTSSVVAGTKLVATGWLISGATTRSIIVYHDSGTTGVNWAVGSAGTFTVQTDFAPTPVFINPQRWYDIQMDPKNKNQLMFTVADDNTQLFAKRLVMTSTPGFTWTNSDGGAALEATLGQSRSSPYSFVYWRNP